MDNHAINAASEILKQMIDEGLLSDLFNYDQTLVWMANIIAQEYQEPLIGFLDKSEVAPQTITDALLEFGEGDYGTEPTEHLREY